MKKWWLLLFAALPVGGFADVVLPGMFSDHAVLARLPKTPVFGKADAGEAVTVEFAGMKAAAVADAKGRWQVGFDLMKTAEGPHVMTVKGKNTVTVKDILIGQVWLCAGQSNMEVLLKNAKDTGPMIRTAKNDRLRLFTIPHCASKNPVDGIRAVWQLSTPRTAADFPGVGYVFGRKLQQELDCPVGLIKLSWGGSLIEAWLPKEELTGNRELADWCRNAYDDYMAYDGKLAKYLADFAAWRKDCHLNAPEPAMPPADAKWEPKAIVRNGLNRVGPAVIWYRKTIRVPEEIERKGGDYRFYQHCVNAVFFIDGKPVAQTTPAGEASGGYVSARFKPGELKAGDHELMIRYWCLYDDFLTKRLSYRLPGKISLMSGYERCIRPVRLTEEQVARRPVRPGLQDDANRTPGLLYNGMVHPLKPYGINGCIWYQGCSNFRRPWQYPAAVQSLIRKWRRDFGWEFPFFYCQLANFRHKESDPNIEGWAEIRHGQDGALAMPNTARAVLIDCGESEDIHPRDKITPGNRLAAIALAKVYGRRIPFAGPEFRSMKIEGDRIRIFFDHVEGGLAAKALPGQYAVEKKRDRWAPLVRNTPESQLEGFAVAAADGKFHWANAKIEGDTVVVWSEHVKSPERVRYAYQSNPTCNLCNKAGFPAAPFDR